MTDLLPIQVAIYSALVGPSGGPYPVFDAVPQNPRYPYIVIGQIQGEPGEELAETTTVVFITLDTYSKQDGKEETHEMQAYIASVLDNVFPLEVDGAWWQCFEEFRDAFEDAKSTADSRKFHGVSRYQIRT